MHGTPLSSIIRTFVCGLAVASLAFSAAGCSSDGGGQEESDAGFDAQSGDAGDADQTSAALRITSP